MIKKILSSLLIILLLFSACKHDSFVLKEEKVFENNSWNKFDNLSFNFNISDIESSYNFYLVIDHTSKLKTKKIPLSFYLKTPSGEERTLNYYIKLIDNNGNFIGEKIKENFNLTILMRKNYLFKKKGNVKIEIVNQLSKLETPGFVSVELIIKKSKK